MDPIAVGTMSALYGRAPQRFADWARENAAAWQ